MAESGYITAAYTSYSPIDNKLLTLRGEQINCGKS